MIALILELCYWFVSQLTVRNVLSEEGAMVTVDVGLAYRDDTISEWTEMARSFEQRKLNCNFTTAKV